MSECACQNCDWHGDERETHEISDFWERINPGEICPVGQCPNCGALVHFETHPIHGFKLGDTQIRYREHAEGLHVYIDGRGETLTFNFTSEGLIMDVLEDGEVVDSFSRMYDELADADKGL